MSDTITNYEDTISSTDIIERIEELEETESELSEDEAAELSTLRKIAREGSDYAEDWQYGETMIRDSYFEEYYTELIQETSDVKDWDAFPFRHINWEDVAKEGKQDYTSIDFDGITYWVR